MTYAYYKLSDITQAQCKSSKRLVITVQGYYNLCLLQYQVDV